MNTTPKGLIRRALKLSALTAAIVSATVTFATYARLYRRDLRG